MSQFHGLVVKDVRRETRDTVAVTFDVPPSLADTFRYTQGQHLTLRSVIDGVDQRRSYSICAGVQEARLRVAIKRIPGGIFSSWANEHLAPGQIVQVMPPEGNFYFPLAPDNDKRYLAIAAGSGITPILSIIKTTLATEPKSHFTLVYGNRASSTVIFREELSELKDQYLGRLNLIYVMSREHQEIELFNGRITKEKCERLFESWIDVSKIDGAFLCGPAEMITAANEALTARGVAKGKIKTEFFAPSTPPRSSKERSTTPEAARGSCEVTVILDGARSVFTMNRDEDSVLEAGIRNGIDMRYSCRGGVCATCRCKVTEGKVDMDTNYALEDYEIARGFILSCQSYPVTDKLVVDFDQHS